MKTKEEIEKRIAELKDYYDKIDWNPVIKGEREMLEWVIK